MKLLNDLFTTDYGLMSITGIAMMVLASVTGICVVLRKVHHTPTGPGEGR